MRVMLDTNILFSMLLFPRKQHDQFLEIIQRRGILDKDCVENYLKGGKTNG